ncbi:CRISPR system precrRNA processing endoribonuclease RAMP protein Cas6 [Tepidimonas sediminis]|nr:CRISPR system precrRNA processing endoribonuclease RAMP protein Cas6 [Tepidimonas sediminis]
MARPEKDLSLPDYAGSLLRSVFGAALRKIVCVTGEKHCSVCSLYRRCAYPAIFETPPRPTTLKQQFSQVPNPYVIEPPTLDTPVAKAGQHLQFHMVLVGDWAIGQLPLLVEAWQHAFRQGLGRQRIRLHLERVQWCKPDQTVQDVWTAESGRVAAHRPKLNVPEPPEDGSSLRLMAITPLRLQHQGKPLRPEELSVRTLLLTALRRASLMSELHMDRKIQVDVKGLLELVPQMRDQRDALTWRDWTRYSSRQGREMILGGVVGPWILTAPSWSKAWSWLWLGQWLHLGKNVTMGLGQYHLEVCSCG